MPLRARETERERESAHSQIGFASQAAVSQSVSQSVWYWRSFTCCGWWRGRGRSEGRAATEISLSRRRRRRRRRRRVCNCEPTAAAAAAAAVSSYRRRVASSLPPSLLHRLRLLRVQTLDGDYTQCKPAKRETEDKSRGCGAASEAVSGRREEEEETLEGAVVKFAQVVRV